MKRFTGTPDCSCSCCLHLFQQLLQLQPLQPQHIHVSNLKTVFFLNDSSSYSKKEILIFYLKFDCTINYIFSEGKISTTTLQPGDYIFGSYSK